MDDDGFDDLLAGVDEFPGSSQESLTAAATNLALPIVPSVPDEAGKEHHLSWTQRAPMLEIDETASISLTPAETTLPGVYNSFSISERIESIFEDISTALATKDDEPSIYLKPTRSSTQAENRTRRISFPGKTAEEAWRFTVVVRIFELIHEAIATDVVLSKRDIYYRDPALFGNQGVVNRYVDSIAHTFNVPRSSLHVTAAAKGLVAGAFKVCRRDGSTTNAACDKEGVLVPLLKDMLSIDMSAVQWILVIEKEASFRSIAASGFWHEVLTQGVIMTGKGYPDIATRALLHAMCTPTPQNGFASPPAYCLVDFDPDGLAIMSTYKDGSATLAHENEDLRAPQLQWLGLRTKDMMLGEDNMQADQGLLNLTPRDRRKAIKMLERGGTSAHDVEIRGALQTMLMLNTKAELQLLDATPRGMEDLLSSALLSDPA